MFISFEGTEGVGKTTLVVKFMIICNSKVMKWY